MTFKSPFLHGYHRGYVSWMSGLDRLFHQPDRPSLPVDVRSPIINTRHHFFGPKCPRFHRFLIILLAIYIFLMIFKEEKTGVVTSFQRIQQRRIEWVVTFFLALLAAHQPKAIAILYIILYWIIYCYYLKRPKPPCSSAEMTSLSLTKEKFVSHMARESRNHSPHLIPWKWFKGAFGYGLLFQWVACCRGKCACRAVSSCPLYVVGVIIPCSRASHCSMWAPIDPDFCCRLH